VLSSEAQAKWDLMHTFSYAYICQPPDEYRNDEEYMLQRDILFNQIANDVHRTDWKSIYARYNEYLPIRLAYKDAKEYYDARLSGTTTKAYEAIKGYAEISDWQRTIIRENPGCDICYIVYYLKKGDRYGSYVSALKETSKKKKK
jgi:hypothetical protein